MSEAAYTPNIAFDPIGVPPIHKLNKLQRKAICSIALLGDHADYDQRTRASLIAMNLATPTGAGHRSIKLTAKGIWFHCAMLAILGSKQ